MEGIEIDVVPLEHILVMVNALKKLTFWEPALPWTADLAGRHALDPCPDAVLARELTVTLDLPLLTEDAC